MPAFLVGVMKEITSYSDEQVIDLTERFFGIKIRPKVIYGLDPDPARDSHISSQIQQSGKKPRKGWINLCAKDSPL